MSKPQSKLGLNKSSASSVTVSALAWVSNVGVKLGGTSDTEPRGLVMSHAAYHAVSKDRHCPKLVQCLTETMEYDSDLRQMRMHSPFRLLDAGSCWYIIDSAVERTRHRLTLHLSAIKIR